MLHVGTDRLGMGAAETMNRVTRAARNLLLIGGAAVAAATLLQIFDHPALAWLASLCGAGLSIWLTLDALTWPGGASGVADVKADAASLKKLARGFEPTRYIALRRGIFLGLDDGRRPIYWPHHVVTKNHIEVIGESGVGKSSLAGVLLSQLAAAGETIVVFDPKNDRMLPGALARAGREWGHYPVHLVDLRPTAGPQLNPFAGCRHDQTEELLQVALELGKTGDAGVDFYRGGDREATSWIAQARPEGADIQALIAGASEDERVTEKENLWRELRQLGRVRAFHTDGGHDLAKLLSEPGVVYIIGSTTRLEVVAAQKLILQRVLQILDERQDQSRPVALFLDELKYILSPAALRAAGTIRDRNCHLLFAHQSLGDLDDCPGLNPKAVRGAIWGNCGIKIVYKMLDSATARELETVCGQVGAESSSTTRSSQGSSVSTRTERAAHIPAHTFTHLPKPERGEASVGVLIGRGPAHFLSTRWLQSGPAPKPMTVNAPTVGGPQDEGPGSGDFGDPLQRGVDAAHDPLANLDDLMRSSR